ncbi:MAG: M6 family metalloprotease domain-containing protein [Clostridium sp.]|uniref:M6 family metalloprotease domain-containing protein n=1 Tax=Clostridium sp. DSM 8431 TaxID=1761781 RepID=UPI0008F0BA83|nr:M6 family metalloprotease domain-containing protein [Clostridium sp. DSM 8431]MCR4945107.1 M6 family metalloprotease domain-containing protein [Clostridium sp.]SFU45688.1 M6 family metalloprotease domain-containing protein [Clostridium sp. DSM 8431]
MKNIRKHILMIAAISSVCIGTSLNANASVYNNKSMELKQPDNSSVEVKVTGDEYYTSIESIDGYTLCRNDEGWICYADKDGDSLKASDEVYNGENYKDNRPFYKKIFSDVKNRSKHLSNSSRKVEEEITENREELNAKESEENEKEIFNKYALKAQTNSYSKEEINGLTILIDFPDVKSSVTREEIDSFINEKGYTGFNNNGSVRDYFYDISGGNVEYSNTVTEFYTAKHEKSYYDNVNSTDYGKALELVREALNGLRRSGFDFSTLSVDENGEPRAVNILYAGDPDAGWANGLWPHQGYIPEGFYSGGVNIHKYQLSNIGTELSLDTMCHEDCHLLFGFPDLYDGINGSGGCGTYTIMSYISDIKNPAPPDPYCRSIIAGWNNAIDLNSINNSKIEADSSEAGTHSVYKWTNTSNPREYYLIENLERKGRYVTIPDFGLMIWHIDETGDNSRPEGTTYSHYQVSVVQADGRKEIEQSYNNGALGDLFYGGYKDSFNYSTSPSSKWWNNSDSGLNISNISAKGDIMTFIVGNPSYVEEGGQVEQPEKPAVQDSIIDETNYYFYKSSPENMIIRVNLNGNDVSSIKLDNKILVKGVDYNVVKNTSWGEVISIEQSYLTNLSEGAKKLKVKFTAGISAILNLNIVGETVEEPSHEEVSGNFEVSANSLNTSGNTLNTPLTIKAIGNKSYDLSKLKVRYYFTAEGDADETVWIDSAAISYDRAPWYLSINSKMNGKVYRMNNIKANADHYVEYTFSANDVLDNGASLYIGARIAKNDWSSFNFLNDYSYNNPSGVVIYYNGEIVNGVEP